MKIRAILLDAGRELLYRRTLLFYFGLVTLTHLLLLLALQTDVANGVISSIRVFGLAGHPQSQGFSIGNGSGGPMALDAEQLVTAMQRAIAWFLYPSGVFLSLFATASLVPHMLEKGTIDLLLSKPISRPALLGARYLGGVVIAGVNLIYFVGGVGTILGFKIGVWNWGFMLSGLLMTVYFASLLAFMVLFGVLFRSTSISMMIAVLMFVVGAIVRLAHTYADWPALITSPVARFLTKTTVETLYYVLPRSYGVGQVAVSLILHRPVDSWAPVFATAGSGAAALGLAILLFRRIDF